MSLSTGVLVVDHRPAEQQAVIGLLRSLGHKPRSADSVAAAAKLLAKEGIEVALLSLGTADPDAFGSLRRLRSASPTMAILLLASADEAARAAQLLRHGADDYLLSPPEAGELRSRLGRILEHRELHSRVAALESDLGRRRQEENFVCRSQPMRALLARLEQVAPARTTVLIRGESGVGKELVARGIHYRSPRRDRPYVALNCAAIPETLIESELFGHERGAFTGAVARSRGKFELANHGTFFLDEVGELSLPAQARLLRVLEEQEFMRVGGEWPVRVDVRVLAATNANLEVAVSAGRFREDLYFRLKVVTLDVPPLRERGEDVPELVRLFVERLCRANNLPPAGLAPEALAALQEYPWPGNVREMKNLLEGLLITSRGPLIRVSDLPPGLLSGAAERRQSAGARVGMSLADMERDLIRRTLESFDGNRTRAARILEIGVRTLQRKIRLYGLESSPARGSGRGKKNGERQDPPLPGGGAGAVATALPSGGPFRR